MTLSKKSPKPAAKSKTVHRPTIEGHNAAKDLLNLVEKPHLEAIEVDTTTPAAPLAPEAPSQPLDDSFDSRKQFFQMMSQQIAQPSASVDLGHETEEPDELSHFAEEDEDQQQQPLSEPVNRSVGTYRKLAVRFIILAAILVVVVLYFTLVKMTVVISPSKQTVSDSLIVDVYSSNQAANSDRSIQGSINRIEAEESGVYSATGEEIKGEEITGKVMLINKYGKDQPLVATTRLLSSDNKLFRLKSAVTVPAGGQVEAEIYADTVSAEMAIGPTKFTIPGLWSGLQDKIYAESTAAFTYNTNKEKFIEQADIDKAVQDLNDLLVKKVKERVGAKNGHDQVVYETSPATAQVELTDAKVGDKKSQFSIKVKNIVNVISFSSDDIAKIAQQKMTTTLGADKAAAEIERSNLKYELQEYKADSNTATLKVSFNSQVASNNSEFIDKSKLVNLSKSQIDNYLKGVKEIEGFEVYFFPSFIKRSPSLVDRIEVEIK